MSDLSNGEQQGTAPGEQAPRPMGTEREEPKGMKSPAISATSFAMNFLLAVAILAGSVRVYKVLASKRKPPPSKPAVARVLNVEAAAPRRGPYTVTLKETGTVRPKDSIRIVPEISGRALYVDPQFHDGEGVSKGQILFRVDASDYEKEKARVQASLAAAEREIAYQVEQKAALENELKQAKETWQISRKESERIQRLLEKGAAAEAEASQRLMTQKTNEERMAATESRLALIQPAIDRIRSEMDVTRAALASVQLNIERSVWRAPMNGRISNGSLEEGQFLTRGQPIATLESDREFEIVVPVSLSDWEAAAPGRSSESLRADPIPVQASWKDDRGRVRTWEGKAVRMASGLSLKTRMAELIVDLDNRDGAAPIYPGMFFDVSLQGQTLENAIAIPRRALREGDVVYVAKDDRLVVRPVRVWRTEGEETILTGGLEPGDLVIVSAVEEAAPGTPVNIIGGGEEDERKREAPKEIQEVSSPAPSSGGKAAR